MLLLRNDPQYYSQMVENGFRRAKEIDRNATTLKWLAFLGDEVLPRYQAWMLKSAAQKRLYFKIFQSIAFIRTYMRGDLYTRGYDEVGNKKESKKIRKVLQWLEKRIFGVFDK